MIETLFSFDAALLGAVMSLRAEWLDLVMVAATDLGRAGFLWIVLALIAMVFPAHRASAWRLLLAIGLAYLLVDGLLKPGIGRLRPFETLPDLVVLDAKPATFSMPSGHAAGAFAGALAASRVWRAGRVLWWAFAVVVALSRVYLGVHYPSDVIAGALVGLGAALFALGGRHVATYDGTLDARGAVVRP